jgi:hypothetical protein
VAVGPVIAARGDWKAPVHRTALMRESNSSPAFPPRREAWTAFGLQVLAVALATFLRAGLVLLYPLLPLLAGAYGLRVSRFTGTLGVAAVVAIVLSIVNEGRLLTANLLLSLLFIGPVIVILFAEPDVGPAVRFEQHVSTFFRTLVVIQVVNNVIGILQFILVPDDDAFIGLFGRQGQANHGLGLVNGFLFIYAYARWRHARSSFNLLATLFFGLSFVMAFFGLALLVLVVTLTIFHARWLLHPVRLLSFLIVVGGLVGMLYATSKKTVDYNVKSVAAAYEAVRDRDIDILPRKLRLFVNYAAVYPPDSMRLLFGSGPGTFNSRTSFLLNGEYSRSNVFERAVGISRSEVAQRYAHPLWSAFVLAKPFQDGTINQPFSSAIALLSEYGLIFTLLVAYGLWRTVTRVLGRLARLAAAGSGAARVQHDWVKMAAIFFVGMLVGDNLLEFSEVLVFVIAFKLVEVAAARRVAEMS